MPSLKPMFNHRAGAAARRLAADRRGATAVVVALAFVMLTGFAGAAIDIGSWETAKRQLQSAADQMAYSAAIGANGGQSGYTNALAVAKQFGYGCSSVGSVGSSGTLSCSGAKGVTVKINNPPQSGSFVNDDSAWEVVLSQPQQAWFSKTFLSTPPVASSRAVGLQQGKNGNVCILALDTRTGDKHSIYGGLNGTVTVNGACTVADNLLNNNDTDTVDVKSGATLNFTSLYTRVASICDGGNCNGTLNVTNPILYNQPAIVDPYAFRTIPAPHSCSAGTNLVITASTTLNPGTYCGSGGNAAIVINGGNITVQNKTKPGGSGATVLQMQSVTGITTGMTVSDTTTPAAIPAGTTVTAIDTGKNTVTLSTTVYAPSPTNTSGVNGNDMFTFAPASGVVVTLNPGVYILNGQGGGSCSGTTKPSTCFSGDFDITNGAVVKGTGVTIVLTTDSSNGIDVGNMNIDGSSALTITAPTSNINGYQVSGMAIWQNPIAPNPSASDGKNFSVGDDGVNSVSSGGSTDITGVVYFPSQALFYQGGSAGSSCTQIIAWMISFQSSAQFDFPSGCTRAAGMLPVGGSPTLAE